MDPLLSVFMSLSRKNYVLGEYISVMIDRIILNIPSDPGGSALGGLTRWLFTTPAMADPRIHAGNPAEELTRTSILVDCRLLPRGVVNSDIYLGERFRLADPARGSLEEMEATFRILAFNVATGKPLAGAFIPKMGFRYPYVMIAVNEEVCLDDRGELDMRRAERVRRALEQVYWDLLEPSIITAAKANAKLLLASRERILQDRRMSSCWMGAGRFGSQSNYSLGAWLYAIEKCPEKFVEGDYVCTSFSGSPGTGFTVRVMVNIHNGTQKLVRGGGFWKMHKTLEEGSRLYPTDKNALPMTIVVEMLNI